MVVDDEQVQSRAWFSDVFTDTAQLSSFLNNVKVEPDQIVSLNFTIAGPNAWRILVVCRLTLEQETLRRQWTQVEANLRGRKQEVATGGAH